MVPAQLDEARSIGEAVTGLTLNVEEASEVVGKLESLHTGMEAGGIEIRFWLGTVIRQIGTERGKNTVSKIAQQTGVAETTLRIARRFADKFDGDVGRMREWVRSHVRSGKKANWQAVIDLTGANRNPKVLGPKKLLKRLMNSVERSAADLQAANAAIQSLPEDQREKWTDQVNGAATLMIEDAGQFINNVPVLEGMGSLESSSMFDSAPRDRAYLNWLHNFPCPIKGTIPVDAHHSEGLRGMGQKASDFGAIPLSHDLHMEYHRIGHEGFEKKYNISMMELTLNYLHRYITGQWLTLHHLPEPI